MGSVLRRAVAPTYLFACIVLGGSAQGIWANMVLQLIGLGIIGWAALEPAERPMSGAARQLLLLAIVAIAVVAIQAVPLPTSWWAHFGPRARIAGGFTSVGVPLGSMQPLSVATASGLDSLLGILPPLALVCAITRLKAYRPDWLALALIAATLAAVVLGALQVASSDPDSSPWYLYEETNPGRAVGFFANANHMATLLLVTIPFLAALARSGRRSAGQRSSAIIIVTAGIAAVLLVGLALNRSLAGAALAVPVTAACALVLWPKRRRLGAWIIGAAVLLAIGSVVVLETTQIGSESLREHATVSAQSRSDILVTTVRAAREFMPFGSGLGSFRSVYRLYESPDQVDSTYVIHAHNDYAELALELGVAGILLILLLLAWWGRAVAGCAGAGPFARAAAIASAAVLVHSLVDFPLRTAAIAAVFAMCLALLAERPPETQRDESAFRKTRHLTM